MRSLLLLLALLLIATPLFAGPPQTGTYNSTDIPGGAMETGRFSESWVGTGGEGQIGNTINAMSWSGSALGLQWRLWCPSISATPTLVSDTRDANGTGDVVYSTTYSGGFFWLSMAGPWGDNTEDYTGTLQGFVSTSTHQYVNNVRLGVRANVTTTGVFDDYGDQCMTYTINNATFFGTTDLGPKPADFPDFMDSNCALGTLSRGGWGSATQITLLITGPCTVPVEDPTWGQLKALYRE